MKRLLLISLLSLGCLSNLEATMMSYPDYDSYIAAIDKGSFVPYGRIHNNNINSSGSGTVQVEFDGLSVVIQKEGQNGPHVQKIIDARKIYDQQWAGRINPAM